MCMCLIVSGILNFLVIFWRLRILWSVLTRPATNVYFDVEASVLRWHPDLVRMFFGIFFIHIPHITPQSLFPDFFLIWYSRGGGVKLGPLGTAATNRPIMPAPGYYDDGEIIGMMIGKGNRSTRRKPAPVPLCPPQNPHAARMWTRAAAVGSQRLTAWAAEQPFSQTFVPPHIWNAVKKLLVSDHHPN
jgi:hypothetical protein